MRRVRVLLDQSQLRSEFITSSVLQIPLNCTEPLKGHGKKISGGQEKLSRAHEIQKRALDLLFSCGEITYKDKFACVTTILSRKTLKTNVEVVSSVFHAYAHFRDSGNWRHR